MSFRTNFIILFLCLFLTGCNSVKIGYYFADNLIVEITEDYLDWQYSEKSEAHAHIKEMMFWHRKSMLPKYALFLEDQAMIAQTGYWSKEQVQQSFDDYRTLLKETIEGASPYFGHVLALHSQENKLAHLQNSLQEALNERLEDEKSETPEISIEEWVERQNRNLERFIGNLNEDQLAALREIAPQDAFRGMRWLENRQYRQDAFIAFMQDKPKAEEIAEFLSALLLTPFQFVDPDYQAISEKRWQVRVDLHYKILNSLDAQQQQNLIQSLRDYAQDMKDLASGVSS